MKQLAGKELISAIREVIRRSVVDPEFRRLALHNASEAITSTSGKSLPEGTSINFIANQPGRSKNYVLPDPQGDFDELSEEALEQVAGGGCENGVTTL